MILINRLIISSKFRIRQRNYKPATKNFRKPFSTADCSLTTCSTAPISANATCCACCMSFHPLHNAMKCITGYISSTCANSNPPWHNTTFNDSNRNIHRAKRRDSCAVPIIQRTRAEVNKLKIRSTQLPTKHLNMMIKNASTSCLKRHRNVFRRATIMINFS